MPAGVSPCGLEAGAPPDLVVIGPVLPCGCTVLPLRLPSVCWSIGFDCACTVVAADTSNGMIRARTLFDIAHLHQAECPLFGFNIQTGRAFPLYASQVSGRSAILIVAPKISFLGRYG